MFQVASREDVNLHNYGDELNGWWVLANRWNPFAKKMRIPDMSEVASRLAYIRNSFHLAEVCSVLFVAASQIFINI